MCDIARAEEPLPGVLKVIIVRSDLSQNFLDTAKTMDWLVLMFTNKQYGSFFSNHTHIKLIKKFKAETMSTVKRKYTKFMEKYHCSCLTVSN